MACYYYDQENIEIKQKIFVRTIMFTPKRLAVDIWCIIIALFFFYKWKHKLSLAVTISLFLWKYSQTSFAIPFLEAVLNWPNVLCTMKQNDTTQ